MKKIWGLLGFDHRYVNRIVGFLRNHPKRWLIHKKPDVPRGVDPNPVVTKGGPIHNLVAHPTW